jgi:hypothetical protein
LYTKGAAFLPDEYPQGYHGGTAVVQRTFGYGLLPPRCRLFTPYRPIRDMLQLRYKITIVLTDIPNQGLAAIDI